MTLASIARRAVVAVLIAVALLLVLAPSLAPAVRAEDGTDEPVTVILFWGDGCPHCAAEKGFLAELTARHPEVVVTDHAGLLTLDIAACLLDEAILFTVAFATTRSRQQRMRRAAH